VDAATSGLVGALGAAAVVGGFSLLTTRSQSSAEGKRIHAQQRADRKADAYVVLMNHLLRLRFFLRWLDREVRGDTDGRIAQPELLDNDQWNQMAAMIGAFGSNEVHVGFRRLQDQVGELATDISVASRAASFGNRSMVQFRRLTPTELPDYEDRVGGIRTEIVSLEQRVRSELSPPQS
jgi:hypothetical protein